MGAKKVFGFPDRIGLMGKKNDRFFPLSVVLYVEGCKEGGTDWFLFSNFRQGLVRLSKPPRARARVLEGANS